MFKNILQKISILAKGVLGLQLIDPIEVFYLPEYGLVYPVVSKSGNSSVKLKIIQYFNPDFTSKFPEIHRIPPETITGGQVERLFFYRIADYQSFCTDKKIRLVIRNPYDRFYSFYLGVTSGRNVLYRYPSGLHRFLRFSTSISWERLLAVTCVVPDYLADRHFRSQSFYLDSNVRKLTRSVEVIELSVFVNSGAVAQEGVRQKNEAKAAIILNRSRAKLPSDKLKQLRDNRWFMAKYAEDLVLFHEVTKE